MSRLSKKHIILEILRTCSRSKVPLGFKGIAQAAKPPFTRQVASKYIHGYLARRYLSYNDESKGWTLTPQGLELLSYPDMIDLLVARKSKRKRSRRPSVTFTPGYGVPTDFDTELLRLRSMIMRRFGLYIECDAEEITAIKDRIQRALEPFFNELTRIYKEKSLTQVVISVNPREGIIETWLSDVQTLFMTLAEVPIIVPGIDIVTKEQKAQGFFEEMRQMFQTLEFSGLPSKSRPLEFQPNIEAPIVSLPLTEGFLRWEIATVVRIAVNYRLMRIEDLRAKLTEAAHSLGWDIKFDDELKNIEIHRSQVKT